eukprot:12307681-Alexandrium_andersonii.AAC.1
MPCTEQSRKRCASQADRRVAHLPSFAATMDSAGRSLLYAVNAATRALQTAVNELGPCSPPLH